VVSTGCGACHTLMAAGSTGTIGPNLDRSTATQAKVLTTITNGKGTMEAFVTKLTPLQGFYAAEDYHQDYIAHNPGNPYVIYNDLPKLSDLNKKYPDLVVKKR